MTEYTENFELVLYYNRRAVAKPSEPSYEELSIDNINLEMNDLLDLYSNLKKKYNKDVIDYEKNRNDSIISSYVRIPEDDNFIKAVKKFEKNDFFVEWEKTSKKLIDETFVKLLK